MLSCWHMTKAGTNKFNEALKAAERLPEETQDALAEEFRTRVAEFTTPQMSYAQRVEVKRRLSLPRRHIAMDDVRALLRRYNSAL